MFAAVDSAGYRIMFLLHILSVVVAFGPMFLFTSLRKAGETTTIASLYMKMIVPAMVLVMVFGMGLSGLSDSAYEMSEAWLMVSFLIWVVIAAVNWFLVRPAITDTGEAATSKLAAGVGITHLGFLIVLILMIWKPGH